MPQFLAHFLLYNSTLFTFILVSKKGYNRWFVWSFEFFNVRLSIITIWPPRILVKHLSVKSVASSFMIFITLTRFTFYEIFPLFIVCYHMFTLFYIHTYRPCSIRGLFNALCPATKFCRWELLDGTCIEKFKLLFPVIFFAE